MNFYCSLRTPGLTLVRVRFGPSQWRGCATQGKGSGKPSLIQRLKKSWVPLPAGVGITLLAVLQWRRLHKEAHRSELRVAKDWEITCYRALPLRSLSRVFGWASETYIPVKLRPALFNSFARVYGVNTEEMAHSLDYYSSLSAFFTRKLKEGVRPVDATNCLVSPADGTVLNSGRLNSFNIEQVKGVTYSIKTFLGECFRKDEHIASLPYRKEDVLVPMKRETTKDNWNEYKKRFLHNPKNELYQCVVYLSPGDYHRFHSPVNWKVNFRRHFQGELMSVNPKYAAWIPNLFALNERVVYMGTWEHGYFSMTAVGATNVGSIRVYDDKSLETNTTPWEEEQRKEKEIDCSWSKGEEIGEFRMGSTLVLIFEAPPDFKLDLSGQGRRVKVGKALTTFREKGLPTCDHEQQQQQESTAKPVPVN